MCPTQAPVFCVIEKDVARLPYVAETFSFFDALSKKEKPFSVARQRDKTCICDREGRRLNL